MMNNLTVNLTNYTIVHNIEIGGLIYFLTYLSEYLPYTILAGTAAIIGIIGNVLIIGAIIFTKELHSTTYMLVFNLALADIVISTLVDSFTVVGVLIGKEYFDQRPFLCHFLAGICLVSCETSLMNIGFLAINRYFHICHHTIYNKMFDKPKTIIYCVITWLIGISIDIPNIVGWGGHYYDLKTLNCVWNRLASYSYSLFFPLSSIVLPCICIAACYLRIFIYVRKSKSKVSPVITSGDNRAKEIKKSIKMAQGLFASFATFTICWVPYGIIVMSDFHDKLPKSAHMFTMAIAHYNSALNPILYAAFNPTFRRGYINFFRVLFFKKPLKHESTYNTQISKVSDAFNNNNNNHLNSNY